MMSSAVGTAKERLVISFTWRIGLGVRHSCTISTTKALSAIAEK
jgi:hypothetical protein